jgi:hypothetical protein
LAGKSSLNNSHFNSFAGYESGFPCRYHLVLISPTFYEQLSWAQIPKAQKVQSSSQSFLRLQDLRTQKLLIKR